MRRLFLLACVVGFLMIHGIASGQQGSSDVEQLKREVELLKREVELLKRENDLLKRENAELKKGSSAKRSVDGSDAMASVTLGKVSYQYLGTTRKGSLLIVTVLATSKDGIQAGPEGQMTIVDPDGDKYVGMLVGTKATLREGVPVKLMWQFGLKNAFTGVAQPVPSAKVTRFAAVIIRPTFGNDDNTIDFRNVPAIVVTKSKIK